MKLHHTLAINDREYAAGDEVSPLAVYPFFLLHMLVFGAGGFLMAYSGMPLVVSYLYSGFAIFCYLVFYSAIFGIDEVKWMFINAGLGILGIVSQIDWLLSFFGKHVSDYPPEVHVIPVLYFVLYTFLLRHAVIDLLGVRDDETRRSKVEYAYVGVSAGVYVLARLLEG